MKCIETIKTTSISHDVFINTTILYKDMGLNEYYDNLFSKRLEYYKHKTAEDNAKSFYQLFVPDFKALSKARKTSLTLDSSVANNRSEQLFKNIVAVFRKIHYDSYDKFHLNFAEVRELVTFLFRDVIELPKYRQVAGAKSLFRMDKNSLREVFEKYLESVNALLEEETVEPIFLFVSFMVDFINMEVYDFKYNDILGVLILYILMIENGLNVSFYIGFFPKLVLVKDEFFKAVKKSSYQWDEGLAEVVPLLKYIINIYHSMYDDLKDLARDLQYDKDMTILKSDYIENIILKMPETFSKQDIRKKHPLVSDSTINRTLKRMQDSNIIRSLGKGRSAKWVKIIDNENEKGQLKLHLGGKNE